MYKDEFYKKVYVDVKSQESPEHFSLFVCSACKRPQPSPSSLVCFGMLTHSCSAEYHKLCKECGSVGDVCGVSECTGVKKMDSICTFIDPARFWMENRVYFTFPCGESGDIFLLNNHFQSCKNCSIVVGESLEDPCIEILPSSESPKLESLGDQEEYDSDETIEQNIRKPPVKDPVEDYDSDATNEEKIGKESTGNLKRVNVNIDGDFCRCDNPVRKKARKSFSINKYERVDVRAKKEAGMDENTQVCPCGCLHRGLCGCRVECPSLGVHTANRFSYSVCLMQKVLDMNNTHSRDIRRVRLLRIMLSNGNKPLGMEDLHDVMGCAGFVFRSISTVTSHVKYGHGVLLSEHEVGKFTVHDDFVDAGRKLIGDSSMENWFPGTLCKGGCGRFGQCT